MKNLSIKIGDAVHKNIQQSMWKYAFVNGDGFGREQLEDMSSEEQFNGLHRKFQVEMSLPLLEAFFAVEEDITD